MLASTEQLLQYGAFSPTLLQDGGVFTVPLQYTGSTFCTLFFLPGCKAVIDFWRASESKA